MDKALDSTNKTLTEQNNAKVKGILLEASVYNPDNVYEKLAEETSKHLARNDGKLSQETMEAFREASIVFGLNTHLPIAETVREEYRPLLIEVIRNLEKENDCQTTNEKILVETIASAYVRVLQYSKKLNYCLGKAEVEISRNKNEFYGIISKELDRAQRQLNSALLTLKQMKSPSMELTIKAKTAFIANNQQNNAFGGKTNDNEINKRQ